MGFLRMGNKRGLRWIVGVGLVFCLIVTVTIISPQSTPFFEIRKLKRDNMWTLKGHPNATIIEIGTSRMASKMFADGRYGKYHDVYDGTCFVEIEAKGKQIRLWGQSVSWRGQHGDPHVEVEIH